MSTLYTHKDYSRLLKLSIIASGCYGCTPGSIKGIKDTPEKIMVIYLAKQLFSLTDAHLAVFFSINKAFMQIKLEELSIEFLINKKSKELVMSPAVVFARLELIEWANG